MAAPNALQCTANLYKGVIEDVITNIKEAFLDEGVDESLLLELKQTWENKLKATKAVDPYLSSANQQSSSVSHLSQQQRSSPSVVFPPRNTTVLIRQKQQQNNGQMKQEQQNSSQAIIQLDGPGGVSDEEEDEIEEDDLPDDDDDELDEDLGANAAFVDEGEPLNSEDDDVVNENADELFEAEDTIVCQYEKVTRQRNKWKFVFKDGVINLNHKEYVFNKAVGESEF